jgi:phosphoserine aminotransferase
MTPTRRPTESRDDQLTLVDAVSSAGAVINDFTQSDAYYFSPQKAFSSDGGIWFAVLSPKAIERAYDIATANGPSTRWAPPSLSLTTAIENSRRNRTYNTPAIATLLLMQDQIRWLIENGGMAWASEQSRAASALVYEWADRSPYASPFVANPDHRSTVTCVVDLNPRVDIAKLFATLRASGIVDVEPYPTISAQQLRIACFPSIDIADVGALLACVEWTLERLTP